MKVEKSLKIDGMTCGHCAMTVRQELEAVDGLTVKTVTIGNAVIEIDDQKVTETQLKTVLNESGYTLASIN